MENDLRLKITNYFDLNETERRDFIQELTDFYFTKNVSTRSVQEFEVSIGQLIFHIDLEHRLAVKTEAYNRAEIYSKLSKIFHNIRKQFLEEIEGD